MRGFGRRKIYFIKGNLDEKLPSYEVFKMRQNRGGLETSGVENRGGREK